MISSTKMKSGFGKMVVLAVGKNSLLGQFATIYSYIKGEPWESYFKLYTGNVDKIGRFLAFIIFIVIVFFKIRQDVLISNNYLDDFASIHTILLLFRSLSFSFCINRMLSQLNINFIWFFDSIFSEKTKEQNSLITHTIQF